MGGEPPKKIKGGKKNLLAFKARFPGSIDAWPGI